MPTISMEQARLMIGRWADSSASLFVHTSEQPGDVRGRFKVVAVPDGGVELKAADGDAGILINFSSFETTCWYYEPREFSDREEYKEWVATLSGSEKMTSSLGFSFSVRVQGPPPLEDLLVPLGKVVLIELSE